MHRITLWKNCLHQVKADPFPRQLIDFWKNGETLEIRNNDYQVQAPPDDQIPANRVVAAHQIAAGMYGMKSFAIGCWALAFDALLIVGLLQIILGFEGLDRQSVALIFTLIHLCLAPGLVSEHLSQFTLLYLAFAVVSFAAIGITRLSAPSKRAAFVLAGVHGVAGMTIFLLPMALSTQQTPCLGDIPFECRRGAHRPGRYSFRIPESRASDPFTDGYPDCIARPAVGNDCCICLWIFIQLALARTCLPRISPDIER